MDQIPQVKGSVPQDGPHFRPQSKYHPSLPALPSDLVTNSRVLTAAHSHPYPSSIISYNNLQNSGKCILTITAKWRDTEGEVRKVLSAGACDRSGVGVPSCQHMEMFIRSEALQSPLPRSSYGGCVMLAWLIKALPTAELTQSPALSPLERW